MIHQLETGRQPGTGWPAGYWVASRVLGGLLRPRAMDSTNDNYRWQDDERARMAMMLQEVYARVWYELCVAMAVRSGCVAFYAGHSARGAHLYRVLEPRGPAPAHVVYHFFQQRRLSCTCQVSEARHLPCAHVGATVLYLQALARSEAQR